MAARPTPLRGKRLLDLVGASASLLLAAPVLALAGAAIWIEDGGPVLFRQVRAGRHGRPFTLYKLRTLRRGDHDPENPEDHATRVGRVLRRWSLDELPQLWNVLRGAMSLVGPRPALPEQAARYDAAQRRRLAIRPGLTGWAQIHGRNALSWPARIRLDVWYVEHRSLWLDLRILLRTPAAVLSGRGLYGPEGRNRDFRAAPVPDAH
ncbi:MAG: sugar transferase [Bacteroidetes bacterium]|jgi:lipopolysaccharide/colanic/teichoic acid biosynthesis glycosyltransferase|nr:sugar transferase [Bacteroidota bacterium]